MMLLSYYSIYKYIVTIRWSSIFFSFRAHCFSFPLFFITKRQFFLTNNQWSVIFILFYFSYLCNLEILFYVVNKYSKNRIISIFFALSRYGRIFKQIFESFENYEKGSRSLLIHFEYWKERIFFSFFFLIDKFHLEISLQMINTRWVKTVSD